MRDLQEAILKCADVRQWVRQHRVALGDAPAAMVFFRLTLFDIFSGADVKFSPSGQTLNQSSVHTAVAYVISVTLLFSDRVAALLLDPLAKFTVSVRIDEVNQVSLFSFIGAFHAPTRKHMHLHARTRRVAL